MPAPSSDQPPNQQQAKQQAGQTEKTQLPIAELQNLGEGLTPGGRRDKRHEAFHQQDQRHSQPERGAVQAGLHAYFLLAGDAEAPPRSVLKKSELLGSSTNTSLFLEKLAL